jgi:hypothetical protein
MTDAEYQAAKAAYLSDARRLQSGQPPQSPDFYTDEMRAAFIARDLAKIEVESVDARSMSGADYAAHRAAFLKNSR